MFLTEEYRKTLAIDECIILDQTGTGSVFCNITKAWDVNNEVETTDHAIEIEEGSPEITDSIHNKPKVLNLNFLLKPIILPQNLYAVRDYNLTVKERYEKLFKWKESGTLLQIIYGDESEASLIIKTLNKVLEIDSYAAYSVSMVLKEVRLYSSLGGDAIPKREVNENTITNRWVE